MKKKTKTLILSVVVTLILLLTFTVTYAIFAYQQTGNENNQLVMGDIWMSYNESNGIDLSGAMPGDDYSEYFEFTIKGKNTYTEKDIWYDVILSRGDLPEGKTEDNRILDKYLNFKLVEVNDDLETIIFTDKTYSDINGKRIHVEIIPKNQVEEYNKTYRLYMIINDKLTLGNTSDSIMTVEDYKDAFASVKVAVTGDFEEKELPIEYTPESCFETVEIITYTHNTNMTEEELATCVTYVPNLNWSWDEGTTAETFCQGTGTIDGMTFQEVLDYDWFSEEELIYLEENNIIASEIIGLSITNYDTSCGTDVVIPKTVNNLPVREIAGAKLIGNGYNGTFGEKGLTSVIIPNTIILIGSYAFEGNQLTSIDIPDSVMYIHTAAFSENQLTSVMIPNNVIEIGGSSFQRNKLASVTFEENSKLESIEVGAFTGSDHTITEVTIPNSVTYLDCSAFDSDVVIYKSDSLTCTDTTPV